MNERKSLLYFSNHLRGPKGSAGARTWHQVKRISDAFDVTVVIPAVDPVTARPVTEETYEGLDFDRVTVSRIDTVKNDRSSLTRRAYYYVSAMRGQIAAGFGHRRVQVVMSMGLPVTMLFIAWLTAIRHRAKFVVDVRDLPFDMALEIGYIKSRTFIRFARAVEGFLLRRADHVLINSPRYKAPLVGRGIADAKITVAYIGYDNFGEPPAREVADWRARLLGQLDPDTEVIGVFAGTLGYALSVDDILEGARLLSGDRRLGFVFLGDGQRLDEIVEKAARYGINAAFLGRVPKTDVVRICRAVDYCFYPASSGTYSGALLGNKVFDYLGARKPIFYIGGDSAVKDVVQQIDAGVYVESGAPEAIADRLRTLTGDPALRERLGRNAAASITENTYTAQKSADILAEILDGLVP